jgi:hypothetical protein
MWKKVAEVGLRIMKVQSAYEGEGFVKPEFDARL